MMKRTLLLFSLAVSQPAWLFAQLFTRVTTGAVVTSAGDSRSVNFVDVNKDGWEDLFISNGPQDGDHNFLYLNNGDGSFSSLTNDDLVTVHGAYDGATFGDYDNDGDPDVLVVTWWGEKNHFFRNEGNGTFTEDVTVAPAIPNTYSETATWGDYDLDGWLDLYVTNSDGDFKNLLYHNNGDGTFTKITSGMQSTDNKTSRGATWIDYDLDGDEDLFVVNESSQPNNLYNNNGDGTFTKVTSGPIVSDTRSTMSASWGDIDNDGDPDLFTANSGNFTGQKNQLYINNGDGSFTEITTGDAVNDPGCSFSSAFEDYDNDGDLDLVVSNGFCNGTISNFLYLNDGSGNFTRDLFSISDLSTPCSYGAAFGDVNNDGFPELVFATCNNNDPNINAPDIFYLNNGNGNHWLKVNVEGTTSNRSAIGAKVYVKATIQGSAVWQYREITSQSGYCSQNSMIAHFGMGDALQADSIIVQFPGGADTVLIDVETNQPLHIKETALTGIASVFAAGSLQCFPNPSGGLLNIILNSEYQQQVTLRLLNTNGVMVRETHMKVVPGKNFLLWNPDHADSLSGMYFLEAVDSKGSGKTKVNFR